jgi:cytochrome c-type biogenesis protein CcmE
MKRNKRRAIIYAVAAVISITSSLFFKTLYNKNIYYIFGETVAFILFAIFLIAAGFAYSKDKDER